MDFAYQRSDAQMTDARTFVKSINSSAHGLWFNKETYKVIFFSVISSDTH